MKKFLHICIITFITMVIFALDDLNALYKAYNEAILNKNYTLARQIKEKIDSLMKTRKESKEKIYINLTNVNLETSSNVDFGDLVAMKQAYELALKNGEDVEVVDKLLREYVRLAHDYSENNNLSFEDLDNLVSDLQEVNESMEEILLQKREKDNLDREIEKKLQIEPVIDLKDRNVQVKKNTLKAERKTIKISKKENLVNNKVKRQSKKQVSSKKIDYRDINSIAKKNYKLKDLSLIEKKVGLDFLKGNLKTISLFADSFVTKNGKKLTEVDVFKGLILQESGGNFNVRSSVGAVGFSQLMPSTAKWAKKALNLKYDPRTNPISNLYAGAFVLNSYAKLMYKYHVKGDDEHSIMCKTLASYNSGPYLKAYRRYTWKQIVEKKAIPAESIMHVIFIKSRINVPLKSYEKRYVYTYVKKTKRYSYLRILKKRGAL